MSGKQPDPALGIILLFIILLCGYWAYTNMTSFEDPLANHPALEIIAVFFLGSVIICLLPIVLIIYIILWVIRKKQGGNATNAGQQEPQNGHRVKHRRSSNYRVQDTPEYRRLVADYDAYNADEAEEDGGLERRLHGLLISWSFPEGGPYRIYRNVYVPHKNGYSEIDLILVHRKGIFVLECKNFSGRIYGSMEQQRWTEWFTHQEKYQFYNPIWQNRSHVKALSGYLGIPPQHIISYVVFADTATLAAVGPCQGLNEDVLLESHVPGCIRHYMEYDSETNFTEEDLEAIDRKLSTCIHVSKAVREAHIRTIQTKCPYCGGRLVKRQSRDGYQFVGCSNYPRCRFTRSI